MRSSLTCPLIAQGKPVGFLFFSSQEKNTYQGIHQDIFLQIAGQISLLVEKSRLYQQLYELNQRLLFAQHELQHQATHDALTGIYNRGAILEHMEAQLARAQRQNKALGVIMLDVDHFKQINDTHGHHAGDAVLRTIADRMKECLREYDYIGRYGGEEFLVVLGDADYETAIIIAERINQAIGGGTIAFGDKRLAVTISAGVTVAENCTELDADKITLAADQELYKAKSNGRNRVKACRI
jgi:diguanylate cyclase (GGDEF)-like protein